MPRPMVVATAAPATPRRGNGPQPNTRKGPSTMLMPFASQSVRIAMVASPAPRKLALIRNSRMTVTLPPSITRVKRAPTATTAGEPPIAASSRGAKRAPATATAAARAIPSTSACAAARAAPAAAVVSPKLIVSDVIAGSLLPGRRSTGGETDTALSLLGERPAAWTLLAGEGVEDALHHRLRLQRRVERQRVVRAVAAQRAP